jgi:hypothetical protein
MMTARDIRVGTTLWLTCEDRVVTVASIHILDAGYLRISYLETKHRTEIHREDAVAFINGWRSI